ncbi:MAG: alpha/beta hydrolase [Lachnospiraceae bacterium]|nr:alpha/beta hydrolase [Lachnospiraceae bacterium]
MNYIYFIIGLLFLSIILVLLISYICFRIVFYVSRKEKTPSDEILVPDGEIYKPYHELMRKWTKETREFNHQDFTIKSHDGLRLHAKYFEYAPNAVCEIMFHGYRGSAERDLSGGIQRCFALGRNVLLVDQRTSCGSEGNVISFGINEHRDCLSWIDFAINHFGPNVKLILTGISMGASTVLMAAGKPIPPNVVGVLADCGFSTPKEILKKCAKDMHIPPILIYPFIKLGAKIFGHFSLEEYSPLEAMKTCKVPVLFFHGEADSYVPCYMSKKLYDSCKSPKRIVTVPNAEHGLVYLVDNPGYFQAVVEFFSENGVPTELVRSLF